MAVLNWFTQAVTFYRQWQSEKAQRQFYEGQAQMWSDKATELNDKVANLNSQLQICEADLSECQATTGPGVPPTIGPTVIRDIGEEQRILMFKLIGHNFKFGTWEDLQFAAASVSDITGTIIPYIQRHMYQPWSQDFNDCNTFARFQAQASRMFFKVSCCHSVMDRDGTPEHAYTIWLPSDGEAYVCEPNPKETGGAFFTKVEDFVPDAMHRLNNLTIE